MRGVPQALEYLHFKGIVHFGVKTGNLVVGFTDKQPTCKVCDFGFSPARVSA